MKVVILAGGLGTRLSEETHLKPKPLVEIGGRPVLWHIMKTYAHFGFNEFIVCCGYKGYLIKEYFKNYKFHDSDVTFDLKSGKHKFDIDRTEKWTVTLADTGLKTNTGGRLRKIKRYLPDNEPFLMTYGDGVSDVDITRLVANHKMNGSMVTLTSVIQPGRFGNLMLDGETVVNFAEKPILGGNRINGGFFVINPSALNLIKSDECSWEFDILPKISLNRDLRAYEHDGFWAAMDTLRDKVRLDELWKSEKAKWKLWDD